MKEKVKKLLKTGEGRTVEFKTAGSSLPASLYETVCAFLNRDGGDILLGVTNDGTPEGVNRDSAERMRQDFANAVNNPQKINPPCYLSRPGGVQAQAAAARLLSATLNTLQEVSPKSSHS